MRTRLTPTDYAGRRRSPVTPTRMSAADSGNVRAERRFMRKLSHIVLAGAAVLALATGCSKNSGESSNTTTTTTTTTQSSAPAVATPANAASDTSAMASPAAQASASGPSTTSAGAPGAQQGDATKGKQIFANNCSSCHGANGQGGGIGPSLVNEKSRKNFAQTVTWIENPQPPMPKLYPSPLSLRDVQNVAAYVQTL